MPDFRRYHVPGGTYFFTVVTLRRTPLFRNSRARRLLGIAMRETQDSHPFEIVATVLLPDHFHMVCSLPPGDANYPDRLKSMKAKFTSNWLREGGNELKPTDGYAKQRRRGVWQARFIEHTIQDEIDLSQHIDYIHYNPVKHGFVRCAGDWEWSSFHRFVQSGDYEAEWGCSHRPAPDFTAVNSSLLE